MEEWKRLVIVKWPFVIVFLRLQWMPFTDGGVRESVRVERVKSGGGEGKSPVYVLTYTRRKTRKAGERRGEEWKEGGEV